MGRRNRGFQVNRHRDGHRSSVGNNHVADACAALDDAAKQEATLMVTETFGAAFAIHALVDDIAEQKLRAVYGLTAVINPTVDFRFPDMPGSLRVNFDNEQIMAPTTVAQTMYPDRFKPLKDAIVVYTQIREKYAKVKAMLRWFHINATPAAVRAYWPAILVLCPSSQLCKDYPETPERYTIPSDIGKYLALIRETTATVAAMQLIPKDTVIRPRGSMWLTFTQDSVTQDEIALWYDPIQFNL